MIGWAAQPFPTLATPLIKVMHLDANKLLLLAVQAFVMGTYVSSPNL